jgi:hypothetical protein
MMLKKSLAICFVLAALAITLATLEGVYALWRGDEADTSIAYKAFSMFKEHDDPGIHYPVITDARVFDKLLASFKADGVGLGNSKYDELRTERAASKTLVDGCKVQKPNLDKTMTLLRAGLYEPFSPVVAFYDTNTELRPMVRDFIDRYSVRPVRMRTNSRGERLTLPLVEADEKVIVAGDSVANGALLGDDETLASRLQALDPTRQYINIGINGASAYDIVCALQRAAERYRGQIVELIYVYCENDFEDLDEPMGVPEQVVEWLTEFVEREGIQKTTIVFAPYIYNIVPYLTRFRGYRGGRWPSYRNDRERLFRLAREAQFGVVDMADIALREIDELGTPFAALSLFMDHAHWSPVGTTKMAARLR